MIPRQFKVALLAAFVFASCNPMRGCPESNFNLKQDSRLPKWFSVPYGYSRADVNVTLTYYTPLIAMDDATMELADRHGLLATATGKRCSHPAMRGKRNAYGGFEPDSYPHYVIVTVKGISEVFEHARMEPFYSVTDDPVLVAQAKESIAKGECQ